MLERINAKLSALHGGAVHVRIFGYFISMPEDIFADVTSETLLDAEAAWDAGKPFDVLSHVCAALDEAFEDACKDKARSSCGICGKCGNSIRPAFSQFSQIPITAQNSMARRNRQAQPRLTKIQS